ncbi:MAG: endonuclease [Actinomycetia bacterium]|nr:endonuclease [Actinomycetes bacterium]
MCTDGAWPGSDSPSPGSGPPVPGSEPPETAAEALAMMDAALDFLNGDFLAGPGGAGLDSAGLAGADLGGVLESLGGLSAKFAAARAAILGRFDAVRGHDADGYGSSAAWLAAKGRTTRRAANAEVRRMRQFRAHPVIAAAVASGEVSESWAVELADWTSKLPADWRHDVDKLLVDTAAAGANLEDLAVVAAAAYAKWRQQQPDPDDPDDGYDDRYLKLGTTIDNAGRVNANLTPECTAALQAVLESLGKKAGPEDDRTEPQRLHDALQLACELLIRAKMVPDRAGAATHADVHIALAELLTMDGASELTSTWLAAMAGEPGCLTGKDAEAAACDALIVPVVTGQPDLTVVDKMIGIVLAYLDSTGDLAHSDPTENAAAGGSAPNRSATPRSEALSPEAWRALRYAMARLAVDLVSGPAGLAAVLRQGLLQEPFNSRSIPLDIGWSHDIPAHVRRAVLLRDRHCAWPGCRKSPAHCDVHHLRHKRDGGETSLWNCALLCQFHHDVCIHRRGWRLVLHPDGTTTAYGPNGQVLHSHGPPDDQRPPDDQGPPDVRGGP